MLEVKDVSVSGTELVSLTDLLNYLGFRELTDDEVKGVVNEFKVWWCEKSWLRWRYYHDRFAVWVTYEGIEAPRVELRHVRFCHPEISNGVVIDSYSPLCHHLTLTLNSAVLVTSSPYLLPVLWAALTSIPTYSKFEDGYRQWEVYVPWYCPIMLEAEKALRFAEEVSRGTERFAKEIMSHWLINGYRIEFKRDRLNSFPIKVVVPTQP